MIIKIFAGTSRVTAELKKFGMLSAFGTDHVRHKQAAAQVVIADLTTDAGVGLLMQWLSDKNVVGAFIAPPCGSASRARSIPLKRKRPGDPPAVRQASKRIAQPQFCRPPQDLQGQQVVLFDI